jgi:hypothetical protein
MTTHLSIEMNGNRYYNFQPRGLDTKTKQPLSTMWVVEERLKNGNQVPDEKWPLEVLGTEVEDKASGFKGMAVSMCVHINGCVHFNVQPQGLQESGSPVETANFDYRRLKGVAIKEMNSNELKLSKKTKPSPENVRPYKPSF